MGKKITRNEWDRDSVKMLRANAGKIRAKKIATILRPRRTEAAVVTKAHALGISLDTRL